VPLLACSASSLNCAGNDPSYALSIAFNISRLTAAESTLLTTPPTFNYRLSYGITGSSASKSARISDVIESRKSGSSFCSSWGRMERMRGMSRSGERKGFYPGRIV